MYKYRCEATSLGGFVQQLAVSYVARGYRFYVTGSVPERKDPRTVDEKLIDRYGIDVSKSERSRRKLAGGANLHYIRLGRFFVLIATKGKHRFYEDEGDAIRDCGRVSIKCGDYAIGSADGHPRVQIELEEFKRLKAYFVDLSVCRSRESLEAELERLPFEPYAPVRRQFLVILRAVNRARSEAGYELVSKSCLRFKRRIYRPFEPLEGEPYDSFRRVQERSIAHRLIEK
jgi:hypothetical protein